MIREIKRENIIELIALLAKELQEKEVDYSVINNSNNQDKLKYVQQFLDKDEILSTYDSNRNELNTFYYEIVEEKKRYERFASDLQSLHDEYEVTVEYIKYYSNLNLYIKIIYTENKDSIYKLVHPILKLKVEYE